jgi:hypothetical protein
MISFRDLAKLLSGESWEDFVRRMNEEKARAALEALVNDDAAMERMAREELPWQPYPVAEDGSEAPIAYAKETE